MQVTVSRWRMAPVALLVLAATACGCGHGRVGGSSCAPPTLEIKVGSSTQEAVGCAGVYLYLGLVKVRVGDVIKAQTPRSHRPGVLPESSAPAVVSMGARSSHGRAERLQAVAKGTADLIVRTPLCPPQNFVTTPSPRVVGTKAVSGPCRIMRVEVAG